MLRKLFRKIFKRKLTIYMNEKEIKTAFESEEQFIEFIDALIWKIAEKNVEIRDGKRKD